MQYLKIELMKYQKRLKAELTKYLKYLKTELMNYQKYLKTELTIYMQVATSYSSKTRLADTDPGLPPI